MKVFELISALGQDQVVLCHDRAGGCRGIIGDNRAPNRELPFRANPGRSGRGRTDG